MMVHQTSLSTSAYSETDCKRLTLARLELINDLHVTTAPQEQTSLCLRMEASPLSTVYRDV